ncbi:MAG: hypothetical protein ACXVH2_06870 [Methanobacterium sp.]
MSFAIDKSQSPKYTFPDNSKVLNNGIVSYLNINNNNSTIHWEKYSVFVGQTFCITVDKGYNPVYDTNYVRLVNIFPAGNKWSWTFFKGLKSGDTYIEQIGPNTNARVHITELW